MSRAIIATCPVHQRRPDWGHDLCLTAISVNRQNPGWGRKWARLPDDELADDELKWVEWAVYTPVVSWTGSDAFLTELDAVPGL